MTTTTTTEPAAEPKGATSEHAEASGEVFLAPRVVDERAFRAFSERLRELVGRASEAQASLDGVSGRGSEVLASLEAAAHTQAERAREITRLLEDAEKRIAELESVRASVGRDAERIRGFEQNASKQLAELTEAAGRVEERAGEARDALEATLGAAQAKAEEVERLYTERVAPRLDGLDGTLERVEQAAQDAETRSESLRTSLDRAESAESDTRERARELDGLRQQAASLLSAMRSTILECADARDAADARLERLSGLASNAGTVLDTVEQRLRRAEERAERITPADLDLDPIVKEVADRVMRALDSRLDTAATRAGLDARAGGERLEERLDEIRDALEMLSSVTLRQTQAGAAAAARLEPIPAAAPAEEDRGAPLRFRAPPPTPAPLSSRTRRVAVMPEGAGGEYGPVRGGACGAVTLWGWTEGAG